MKKRYLLAGVSGLVAGAVATKLLTRPRDVDWAKSVGFIYHPEYSWFTTVNGVRIHYQEAGDETAPPVILIHGFISSTLVWSEVLLPLARTGLRVIAPDLPGSGYSEKPYDGDYTIAGQARVVVRLMDQLGIKKAIIAGASYGAAIAATIALDYPKRVKRLVLVGAVSNDEPKKSALLRIAQVPIVGDVLAPLFLGSRWVLRKRMERNYRRLGRPLDEQKLAARHHVLAAADSHRAILRTVRRWSANRIQLQAHQISQPTLVVWGERDPHTPLKNGERLRDAIPGARLIVFPNGGHLPQQEYPGQFVEVMTAFCRGEEMEGARSIIEDRVVAVESEVTATDVTDRASES